MNFPTITNPDRLWSVQTASFANQVPFYFGGSPVPFEIGIPKTPDVKKNTIVRHPSVKINHQLLRY
jgi:hypothetical protein